MADSNTTNYGWVKPDVGASDDTWGNKLNTNFDGVDGVVKSVSDAAAAAQTTATGAQTTATGATAAAAAAQTTANGAQTTASAALPLSGGTMTGAITLANDPTANLQPATKQYVDATGMRQNRNGIINGQFRVNQRAYVSGASLAAGAYGFDRWKAGASGAMCSFTFTGARTVVTITTGSVVQIIESVNVEGGTYTLSWTGTALGSLNGGGFLASPVTAALPANTNARVEFSGGTLSDVQLELGSQATRFDRLTYSDEFAHCQRYYETSYDNGVAVGTATQNGQELLMAGPPPGIIAGGKNATFKVTKRAAPTVTAYSPFNGIAGKAYDANAAVNSDVNIPSVGQNGFCWNSTLAAGAAGVNMRIQWAANAEL
ncbi:MAG TPA: hypothetical protein VFW22_07850 [Pseudolabrys sp.]|nr:hypothetical protein [Pseudolabrys sp.]